MVIEAVCVKWSGYRCCLGHVEWLSRLFGSSGVVIDAVCVKWGGYRGCLCQVG